MVTTAHCILFVEDQHRTRDFFRAVLGEEPQLDVPGMVEFALGTGVVLGLMPEAGIQRLISRPVVAAGAQAVRAELYLYVDHPEQYLQRALSAGAELLLPFGPRAWGDEAGYVRDFDGHVLAFARRVTR